MLFLLDKSKNTKEIREIIRPKTFEELSDLLNKIFLNIPEFYEIYYSDEDNKEIIINNEEKYKQAGNRLFIKESDNDLLAQSNYEKNYNKLSESKQDVLDEKYNCVLCASTIKNESPFLCYKCQKIFHEKCMKDWDTKCKAQNRNLTCPNCRNELQFEKWIKKLGFEEDRKFISELISIINDLKNQINKNKFIEKYQNYIFNSLKIFEKIMRELKLISSSLHLQTNNKLNSMINTFPLNIDNLNIGDISDIIKEELEKLKINIKEEKIQNINYMTLNNKIIKNNDIINNPIYIENNIFNQKVNNQLSIKEKEKLNESNFNISLLSNLPYDAYPEVKYSREAFDNFSGFGINSYNGKVKNYNEDRLRVIASNLSQSKKYPNKVYHMSYFAIFDGHKGKKCSEFLKKKFFEYLVSSPFFPDEPLKAIIEAFKNSESNFFQMAYDMNSKILLDKSGSCALIILILDNLIYSINLGDSRALYSYNSGNVLLQITRDHKPNDIIEKARIEKYGGKVYYANNEVINDKKMEIKDEKFGEDFTLHYKISPGDLPIARTIGNFYAKMPEFGGIKGIISPDPCINTFRVDDKSDFILMGSHGIFDKLDNDKIFKLIWENKKKNKSINDIHVLCGQISDAIIKYSMEKNSNDNVSAIFIAFKNFENKMKDPYFVCKLNSKTQVLQKDTFDLSVIKE